MNFDSGRIARVVQVIDTAGVAAMVCRTRSSASSVDGRCPLGTHHRAVVASAAWWPRPACSCRPIPGRQRGLGPRQAPRRESARPACDVAASDSRESLA